MPLTSSRPPLTEGAADAISKKTKLPQGVASPSEVPLAFQHGQANRTLTENKTASPSRVQRIAWITIPIVAVILAVIWSLI